MNTATIRTRDFLVIRPSWFSLPLSLGASGKVEFGTITIRRKNRNNGHLMRNILSSTLDAQAGQAQARDMRLDGSQSAADLADRSIF
jgi:hypothetical protein